MKRYCMDCATRTLRPMVRVICLVATLSLPMLQQALAQQTTVSLPNGYTHSERPFNVGGGVSYLPNGDIIAFSADYVSGPSLKIIDANGDGIPTNGSQTLAQFSSSSYGAFVQVSPNGEFALAGLGGASSAVLKVTLASGVVEELFNAPGNYDLAFIDNSQAYISANPGGFNPSVPNVISHLSLSGTPVMTTVALLAQAPSGPVSVAADGSLYTAKGTFQFPAPQGSTTLLKFSSAALTQARSSGIPLTASDAELAVALDGAYDIAVQTTPNNRNRVYISTIGSDLLLFEEQSMELSTFLSSEELASSGSTPALTGLSLFAPTLPFGPNDVTAARLGVSVATNFFSDYGFIQIVTTQFDGDGDGTPDLTDECRTDPNKSAPLECGCGAPETDTNADGIVDCGVVSSFSKTQTPRLGRVTAGSMSLTVQLERLSGKNLSYEVTIKGPGKKGKARTINTSKRRVTVKGLKKGSYKVSYRVVQRNKKKVTRTRKSPTLSAIVGSTS